MSSFDSEATGSWPLAESSRKRQLDEPYVQPDLEAYEKRARRFSRGHDISRVLIQGNAAAHLGDHHVTHVYYGPSQPLVDEGETKASALIKWLQFPRQEARREQIEPAHEETFQWIFKENADLGDGATNFAEWLRAGNGLYWINGKAGSGKSTLMKMLSDDDRTRQNLSGWTGGDQLVLSSFYFWSSGTEMQRSILGLLRSLLCDILEACPEAADETFPRWQSKFSAIEPALEEVKGAFRRIISRIPKKICFLIDGLDEFEGDEIKKAELAKLIAYAVDQPTVKAVVSSRPLQIFKSTFQRWPCLAVHKLTAADIKAMVTTSLHSSEHFQRLCEADPWRASDFTNEIARRSAGVFLWAVWAVKSVLDGCLHEDTLEELDTKLANVPEELDQLFRTMLLRIPHGYRREALRYFKTTLCWNSMRKLMISSDSLTCLELSLAASTEEASASFWSGNLSSNYWTNKERRLRARLHTATQGLLEKQYGAVEFMHKSVVDFLQIEGKLLEQTLAMHKDNKFEPPVAILIAVAVSVCFSARHEPDSRSNAAFTFDEPATEFRRSLGKFFDIVHCAEISTGIARCAPVDQLHRRLRSCTSWNGDWDRNFYVQVLYCECTLYIKEKLRSHDTLFFDACESIISDIVQFAHVFDGMKGQPRERITSLLLSHSVGQNQIYQVARPPKDAAGDLKNGSFCLWEVSLFSILERLNEENDSHYLDLRDVMDMFGVIVERKKTLQASSAVHEAFTRFAMSTGLVLESYALSAHIQAVLQSSCPGKSYFDFDFRRYYEDRPKICDCPCERAEGLRTTVHRILQTLKDREACSQSQLEQHVG